MKMSIEWHKESLANTYKSLERKKTQLEQLQKEVDRDLKNANFYHVQVMNAERQGKDGFDSDKFMKSAKKDFVY